MADEIIRILSIDGGGIRGIIPARLLQLIEESIGEPASTLFHLIAGTSTDGILGCGLAKGKSAREIAELYVDRGGKIFHRSLWDKVTTIDGQQPRLRPRPTRSYLACGLGSCRGMKPLPRVLPTATGIARVWPRPERFSLGDDDA